MVVASVGRPRAKSWPPLSSSDLAPAARAVIRGGGAGARPSSVAAAFRTLTEG